MFLNRTYMIIVNTKESINEPITMPYKTLMKFDTFNALLQVLHYYPFFSFMSKM